MNANDKLVSIVLITYNSSRFILKTLDSISSQTYKFLELIVSDDCSTDETLSICEQWLQNNKERFASAEIVRSKINTGISGNSNRGWTKAHGDWIKFIDGDDLLLPTCIETNMRYIEDYKGAKVVYSEAAKIDEDGEPLPTKTPFYKNDLPNWRRYFFTRSTERQLRLYVRAPFFLITPSIFVSRDLLIQIGGFDERLRILEDVVFSIKALQSGNRLYNIPTPTVAYRLHSQSISRIRDKNKNWRTLGEFAFIYEQYRKPHLCMTNLFDLNARYLAWLQFVYVLKFKLKGARFLARVDFFRVYQRCVSARFKPTN
jgi:alpha-1,3-rhamnosyltransferase